MDNANIMVHNDFDVYSRIKDLSNLQDGWDFGSGYAPSREVIENTCYIFNHFERREFEYEVSPTSSGGVKIIANIGEDFLDLTINPNLTIDLTHEHGFGVNFETIYQKDGVSMEEIELYLNLLSIQSCFLLGRYTLENSVNLRVVSTAIPSETSMVVYPYLITSAL